MRILFIGDIFGRAGRRILSERLEALRLRHSIDVCIANGENAAGGMGVTCNIHEKLCRYGVDIVTGGNHSFANDESKAALETDKGIVLRPANYPEGNVGKGWAVHTIQGETKIGVLNLQGRVFMAEKLACPFRTAKSITEQIAQQTRIIIVDFHAEATSEKKALLYYLDGSITALIGTHTHVQTADSCITPRGTGYISDAGMTGPEHSCIGATYKSVIPRFFYQIPARITPSECGPMINGVVIEVDENSGRTTQIYRIYERSDNGE